jgi:hypothetical protein
VHLVGPVDRSGPGRTRKRGDLTSALRLAFQAMADAVHITPERNAPGIVRSGVAARSRNRSGDRGVYCSPVLSSFTLTYQWVRELRRWHPGVLVAVHIRIPDDEPVSVGRYGALPERLPWARAIATVRDLTDPRGFEMFVPRRIEAAEVRYVRRIPQGVGWRYQPDAHGKRPCACPVCMTPGTWGAAKLRRRFPDASPAQRTGGYFPSSEKA